MFSGLAGLKSEGHITLSKTTTETEVARSTRQTTITEVPRRAKQGLDVDVEVTGSINTRRTAESWTLESSVPLLLLLSPSSLLLVGLGRRFKLGKRIGDWMRRTGKGGK
ncbi:hypothetical protein CDEST_04533 [Colletotrichum destructivum]|uniref:Uncharacterized protein n=1 Tax=Colletotrichum destructivum TaxID=34406 RepID=A0AAX4I818_9PEZI|nr:hypothetical protein CDEST_04533 [Colletotrichum destructivum]